MAKLTNAQKKDWARMLYTKDNFTQLEIAEKVGVSRVTVGKWAKEGKWDNEKASITTTRQAQIALLYRQIAEINNAIITRPQGERFANAKEADAINKITTAIEKLERETSLSDIVAVSIDMLNWLRMKDVEQAKHLSDLFDTFINDKLKLCDNPN